MSIQLQKDSVKKERSFGEICEKALNSISEEFASADLCLAMKVKRDFGVAKYGEASYQSSISNLLNTPTIQHAAEEIVDTMNYLVAAMYQERLQGIRKNSDLEDLLERVAFISKSLKKMITESEKSESEGYIKGADFHCIKAVVTKAELWDTDPMGGSNCRTRIVYSPCGERCTDCPEKV